MNTINDGSSNMIIESTSSLNTQDTVQCSSSKIDNNISRTTTTMEVRKRIENVKRKKKLPPSLNLDKQMIEYLVSEELFLKHVMNVESIGRQMVENFQQQINHHHRHPQQHVHTDNDDNGMNNNNENIVLSMIDKHSQLECNDEPQWFLNVFIGVSQLEYPCKKLITNTLFRGNVIGMNHPFIIIGPYKIDWNDSSFVKLKCDMFRATSAIMVYKYETIRGRENVLKSLSTIARVCTLWNSYKKFANLTCNCHHFIKFLLKELEIENDFQLHPTLVYLLERNRLVKHERIIPWRLHGRMDYIQTIEESGIKVIRKIPKQLLTDSCSAEIIIQNLNQLKLFDELFKSFKKSTSSVQVGVVVEVVAAARVDCKEQQEHMIQEIDKCIDSYFNGYQLRNQTMKSTMIDYSQINQTTNGGCHYSIELEYPLLNGFFDPCQ